jgi:hypothetical protein
MGYSKTRTQEQKGKKLASPSSSKTQASFLEVGKLPNSYSE